MNNYENIKSMSIEEMTKIFFGLMNIHGSCQKEGIGQYPCKTCRHYKYCTATTKEDIKEWLSRNIESEVSNV